MHSFFCDYFWKQGKPIGLKKNASPTALERSYKIVTDPYHKRYTVEEYHFGKFADCVYDSLFLDFRKLRPQDQIAWQREVLTESTSETISVLRNIEDRVLLKEWQKFEGPLCRECRLYSPHGLLLSIHHLLYTLKGDPFNGCILYDSTGRPCLIKRYQADQEGVFGELLEEQWDMEHEQSAYQFLKT